MLSLLDPFSTCDISDALAALSIMGYFTDIAAIVGQPFSTRVSGVAYTAEFVKTIGNESITSPKVNHVDSCPMGSILVIKAPADAPNAVFGGLMTARALAVGCQAAVVIGRIRDADEILDLNFPVWTLGYSTLGAAPFCKLSSIAQDLTLYEESPYPVIVKTGDVIVADRHGVVCFPMIHVEKIAEYCIWRVACDKKCMADIIAGISIKEAFAKHRVRK